MSATRPPVGHSVAVRATDSTVGERIVVVDDGGAAGRAAVRWVADRLGRHPAAVRIVGPVARADDDAAVTARWSTLADSVAVLHTVAPNATVASDVMVGEPADAMCAEAEAADLLVIGLAVPDRGRRDGLSLQLAARAACVVVVVPEDWAAGGETTVVGASVDAASDAALDFAVDHAERERRVLHLVHAWKLPITGELHPVGLAADASIAEVQSRALEALAAQVRTEDLDVTFSVRQGEPHEILREAAEEADLLVVGRRTRSPLTRLLLGSVSRALVLDPPCPVAVVPQPRRPLDVTPDGPGDNGL